MNGALSAPRKPTAVYDKSRSLYGGDMQIDIELDSYFASASSSSSSKKKKGRTKSIKSSPSSSAPTKQSSSSTRSSTKRSRSSLTFSSSFASALADDPEALEVVAEPVQGTCVDVEKDYYRLTSAPVSSAVRPLPVLQQALRLIKERWKSGRDYAYCCNQLKSIRQDLTVQHLRSAFAVDVYETHGRLALEEADVAEFAQILSPLSALYDEQYCTSASARAEFSGYRILLACHHHRLSELSLLSFIAALPPALSSHAYVQHALQVRQALLSHSFLHFFRLYQEAPCMSSYLMDELAAEVRMRGLRVMAAAYRPRVEVRWVSEAMGMGEDECVEWMVAMGMQVREEGEEGGRPGGGYWLDAKHAQAVISLFDDRGMRVDDERKAEEGKR